MTSEQCRRVALLYAANLIRANINLETENEITAREIDLITNNLLKIAAGISTRSFSSLDKIILDVKQNP